MKRRFSFSVDSLLSKKTEETNALVAKSKTCQLFKENNKSSDDEFTELNVDKDTRYAKKDDLYITYKLNVSKYLTYMIF